MDKVGEFHDYTLRRSTCSRLTRRLMVVVARSVTSVRRVYRAVVVGLQMRLDEPTGLGNSNRGLRCLQHKARSA